MSSSRIGAFVCSLAKRHYLFSKPQSINSAQAAASIRFFSATNAANMKYVQFVYKNEPGEIRAGYMEGDNVVDINKNDSSLPSTTLELLRGGCIDKVNSLKKSKPPVEPSCSVTLMAPVTGMDKILCVGLNYADHCREQNKEPPTVPMIFSKFASSIIGQNEPVRLRTAATQKVDWEVELVVVIGKKCSDVKADDAFNYVFGYTVAQDISSRDWQKHNGGQFLLGKSQDTFCPIGPWIVTKDEIADPHNLNIRCCVNGVEKQTSNTCNLIFRIPQVIERLSSVMTLLPGDILLTGTPGGVGVHRTPPEYLKPGDVLYSEVQNVGAFEVKFEKF